MAAPDLRTTIGSLLVGSWFSIAMWGCMSFQAFEFMRKRRNFAARRANLRIMVGALWALDTLHVSFAAHALYWYLIINAANSEAVGKIVWSLPTTIAITAAINFIVQMFFAQRILLLSKNHLPITILIALSGTARLVFGSVTTAKAIILGTFASFEHLVRFLVTTGLALSVFTDLLITGTLVIWLLRNKTGLASDSLIDKVLQWTIQTGVITTFFGLLAMVLAIAMPKNLVWLGSHQIISKLYTTMTIAHLNAREAGREERARQSSSLPHTLRFVPPRNHSLTISAHEMPVFNPPQVSVHVQQEVFVDDSSKTQYSTESPLSSPKSFKFPDVRYQA